MEQVRNLRKIPKETLIFPELIPLIIPEFTKHVKSSIPNVLSFKKTDSETWFNEFAETIISKIGKEYFPVMRMSDGEFLFLLGPTYSYYTGDKLSSFLKKFLITSREKLIRRNDFKAATLPGVSSGDYTAIEIEQRKSEIENQIKFIAEHGVLALHLTYSIKPFQEHFHYKLKKWFDHNHIVVNKENYYPFYFVYALLRGSYKESLLKDKVVLIFHSAQGIKKGKIISALIKEGVQKVIWHEISPNRSMFEQLNLKPGYSDADIAFVGAGVGKFNILAQLEPLHIPCIDVGYVFEVWADENNKWRRPVMVPDNEWIDEKIAF